MRAVVQGFLAVLRRPALEILHQIGHFGPNVVWSQWSRCHGTFSTVVADQFYEGFL